MESLKIKTNFHSENKDIVIVEIGGYIDQTNSGQVEKIISDIISSGKKKIIFDMSDLIYMSSAGWGIFIGEIKTVRDKGGDIKIASMSPEVYEVFEMLEFFHILEDYPTVEKAIESYPDFDKINSSNKNIENTSDPENGSVKKLLNNSSLESYNIDNEQQNDQIVMDMETKSDFGATERISTFKPSTAGEDVPIRDKEIDIRKLPLNEKIKKIVGKYPLLNIIQLRQMLAHDKFGSTQISLFKLYKTLRFLNLDTKSKRYRYYRSV